MIYTTYFSRVRNLPRNIVPIAICGKAPEWWKLWSGLQYKKLAPKYGFFSKWKETGDNMYYVRCFNEQVLSQLDAKSVVTELLTLAGSSDLALVCYEKPGEFCHRHLVAGWLREKGFDAREYYN